MIINECIFSGSQRLSILLHILIYMVVSVWTVQSTAFVNDLSTLPFIHAPLKLIFKQHRMARKRINHIRVIIIVFIKIVDFSID